MLRIILLAFLPVFFHPHLSKACGYDWVGECSSSVHLSINGTLDSFTIADCPSGIDFQGLDLGVLRTLTLANARSITWESCQNNVSGVALRYRIYEQGGAVGSFQTLALEEDYFTLSGPYTTRYRSRAVNQDLAAGLTIGKYYLLEVYFEAAIDTIGDDFIPETTLLKNNNGLNYTLGFTYGGPSAAPFVAIPTLLQEPSCHGASDGRIGISVWGDQTGLFYEWSNAPLNFYQQNNLPAGTYTVTVTGASYATSTTVVLNEPLPLEIAGADIQPIGCGGGAGSATLYVEGGTGPYHYFWENGQTSATASFLMAGAYAVSVVDAQQCLLMHSVSIPIAGLIERYESYHICNGDSLQTGGQVFTSAGQYNFVLPGNNACDTLVFLTITLSDPASLLADLPENILVTCNEPSVNLCATEAPAAVFQWSKDGVPATTTPCLLATAGGVYTVRVEWEGCISQKNIVSEEHLVAPPAFIGAQLLLTCNGILPNPAVLRANTQAFNPSYQWVYDGVLLSTADTCLFSITEFEVIPPGISVPVLPELMVTDGYGCTSEASDNIVITVTSFPIIWIDAADASGATTSDGSATLHISGGQAPYEIFWSNGATTNAIDSLIPGWYCASVTDAYGCLVSDCEEVSYTVGNQQTEETALTFYPNPAVSGGQIIARLPENWLQTVYTLEITHELGQTVLTKAGLAAYPEIRVELPANLPAGCYTLRISGPERRIFGKLLVKK